MSAKIYRPTRNAMQSGKEKTKQWVLEFEQEQPRFNDSVMGWVGSRDMKQEIRLKFATKEDAVAYAKREGIPYKISEPKQPKIILKSYADNFKAS